ncbi:MAG TPA: type II secretion system protein [Methylophilus sp.]
MFSHTKLSRHLNGFTLIEVAIVMIIVGLLISGLIAPLSAQLDARNYNETRNTLAEVKEALIGFALSHAATDGNPYLPCPDTDGDGRENRNAPLCQSDVGSLPTQDLGLVATDSWNNQYIYRVAPEFSNSTNGFSLVSKGNITLLNANSGSNLVIELPALVLSRGKNGAAAAASMDEQENIDADTIFVSHEFTSTFDDLVVWVSPNVLFNRMVTANRLP